MVTFRHFFFISHIISKAGFFFEYFPEPIKNHNFFKDRQFQQIKYFWEFNENPAIYLNLKVIYPEDILSTVVKLSKNQPEHSSGFLLAVIKKFLKNCIILIVIFELWLQF